MHGEKAMDIVGAQESIHSGSNSYIYIERKKIMLSYSCARLYERQPTPRRLCTWHRRRQSQSGRGLIGRRIWLYPDRLLVELQPELAEF